WMSEGETHESAFASELKRQDWLPAAAAIHVIMRQAEYTGSSIRKLNDPKFHSKFAARIRPFLADYCDRIFRRALKSTESELDNQAQRPGRQTKRYRV
ncbi:MAG: hypothetical protein KDA85_10760, partial [Planctomycetaceae bacterium]|nr:hypothetical protein [Planctomycetaceae bacterium]